MNCKNCGYGKGLHRWDTHQCPKGGEAPLGKEQKYLLTVYQEDYEPSIMDLVEQIKQLRKEIIELKESNNE